MCLEIKSEGVKCVKLPNMVKIMKHHNTNLKIMSGVEACI